MAAILAHTCPHCGTERIALNIASVVEGPQVGDRNVLLVCPKCRKPVCAVLEPTGSILAHFLPTRLGTGSRFTDEEIRTARHKVVSRFPVSGDPTDQGWRLAQLWPDPPKPRLPEYLPDEVARALQAAERNFPQDGMREASGGSYRRALDTGTKLIAASMPDAADFEGKQLNNRIDMLRARGRLTLELAEWSHAIKGLGNDAMHELEGITEAELTALRGFTELVLTYLFTLPGMMAARKADAGKAKI